jgi:hypothetical protein
VGIVHQGRNKTKAEETIRKIWRSGNSLTSQSFRYITISYGNSLSKRGGCI